MPEIDFIADEEEAPQVAEAPQPIIPPPESFGYSAYIPKPVTAPQFWQAEYRGETSPEAIARATAIRPPGGFDPAKGLAPLSKLGLTPDEAQAGMEALVAPFLPEKDRKALMESPLAPGPLAKSTAGFTQGAAQTAESLTSPINLGLMVGTAGMSQIPAASRLLSGAFTADMARHVPELSRNLGEAVASKDPEAITRAATELAATGAFTTMAGTHAVGPRPAVSMPETMRELAKEPSTTGAPSAIQEPVSAETVRGLPEQPRVNEPLSAQKGGGEVPPSGVPPGNAQGARGTAEARAAEVPLKEVTIKARTPAGEEINLKMEAGEAQRRFTQRKTVLEALRDCMG